MMDSMTFTMSAGGVPAGNYRAVFIGAEPYRENVEKYGEGVLLKWRIVGGEHDGDEASRICSMKLSPKSALGKFAVAFKGSAIATGEQFSFAPYVGAQGSLIVEPTDGGGSRVSAFLRDAQQPPPAQAQPMPQPMQVDQAVEQPATQTPQVQPASAQQPAAPPTNGQGQPTTEQQARETF